ncbi:MAG: hypothetical protein MUO50_03940 [Longimicrobiales bacterium]|nr:hypothetical protein [Longimicrobiales bacterium]
MCLDVKEGKRLGQGNGGSGRGIPEGVPVTTSVTTARPMQFDTPLGRHSYRHVRPEIFFGYSRVNLPRSQEALLAGLAKALLDLVYLTPRGEEIDTGDNPDGIMYVPDFGEVYAFNGTGHSATVIVAATGEVVATILLSGKPEFAVFDPEAKLIYNNIEDQNEIAVIDPATHEVVASWPIAPGEAASGLAIDLANHRLFAVCENEMMVMLDSSWGSWALWAEEAREAHWHTTLAPGWTVRPWWNSWVFPAKSSPRYSVGAR